MSVSKAVGPLHVDGKVLDLSHLAMITRKVEMSLPGGHKKVARVDFHFSCHCYSRSPDKLPDGTLEPIPAGRLVPDGSVHEPRPRIYCPDRYELSKQLVACIDVMIAQDDIVSRTQHINYFHVSSVSSSTSGPTQKSDYYVFFGIKTLKPDNLPRQFKISVESAYLDANAMSTKNSTFSAALGAVWAKN